MAVLELYKTGKDGKLIIEAPGQKNSFRRRMLVPSVRISEIYENGGPLGACFGQIELDLRGVKSKIDGKEKERIANIVSFAKEDGLGIYSIHMRGYDLSHPHPQEVIEPAAMKIRELGEIMKPKVAVVHPGSGSLGLLLKNLEFVLGKTGKRITLAVENMTSAKSLLNSTGSVHEFVDALKGWPENIGLCIDTTHLNAPYGEKNIYTNKLLNLLETSLPRLKHLHFSDRIIGRHGSKKHAVIGEGAIDWGQIDDFLGKNGYSGKAAIEIKGEGELSEKAIISACNYYSCSRDEIMAAKKSGEADSRKLKEIALEEFAGLIGAPQSAVKAACMPSKGALEKNGEALYFVVPTASYGTGHIDPFYALSGEPDKLEWLEYLFGVRKDGNCMRAILIDKKKRIAVEETIAVLQGNGAGWDDFVAVVRAAKRALKENSGADHVEHSMGVMQLVEKGSGKAWE